MQVITYTQVTQSHPKSRKQILTICNAYGCSSMDRAVPRLGDRLWVRIPPVMRTLRGPGISHPGLFCIRIGLTIHKRIWGDYA